MRFFNDITANLEYKEGLIKKWISQYGSLPRMQIKKMLNEDKDSSATNIIRNLVKRRELFEQEGGVFLSLDPRQRKSERVIKALWVLIDYSDRVRPDEHYPADYPSEIYFIGKKDDSANSNSQEYEIIILEQGEEFKLRHLKQNQGVRYIIVVPTVEDSFLSKLVVPDVEFLFATVTYGCSGEAKIEYYNPRNIKKPDPVYIENDENYYENSDEYEPDESELCIPSEEEYSVAVEEESDENEDENIDEDDASDDENDEENCDETDENEDEIVTDFDDEDDEND